MSEPTSNPTMYAVGGTVQASDGVYLSRRADDELYEACRAMKYAYILTTRQVGKSSLMVRTANRLQTEGTRCVLLDLSRFGVKLSAEQWYLTVMATIQRQLELKTNAVDWWRSNEQLSMSERLALFFQKVMLSEVRDKVVIFVDEIDTTRSLPFSDDFYAVVRSIFHSRVETPEFNRLSFVLIGVATPADLIQDPLRTPFNIGQPIELTDFTFDEALPLAEGLGPSRQNAVDVLRRLLYWTAGHPYLTLKLCRAIAVVQQSSWSMAQVDQLVAQTFFGKGGDQDHNLQYVASMLTKRAPDLEKVLTTYRAVLRGWRAVPDEEPTLIGTHLKLSGVVCRQKATLRMRNEIYKKAFDERWIKEHLPINWPRRLARTAATLIVIILLSSVPLGVYGWKKKGEAERAQQDLAINLKYVQMLLVKSEKDGRAAVEAREIADEANAKLEIERAKVEESLKTETAARAEATKALARAREQQNLAEKNAAEVGKANTREVWNRQGLVALEMSDYETAKSKFSELYKLSRYDENVENTTWVNYNLGTVYRREGDYESAIQFYETALREQESAFTGSSLQVLAVRQKLAEVSRDQGNYASAERHYEQLLSIVEDLRGTTLSPQAVASLKNGMAGLYYDQGRDATTAAIEQKELAARIASRIGDLKDVAEAAESASGSAETNQPDCLGPIVTEQRAKLRARCVLDLAAAERARARFQQAGRTKFARAQLLYQEVVAVKERALPTFTGDLASAYDNLARVYEAQAQEEIRGDSSGVESSEQVRELSEIARVIRQNQVSSKDGIETQIAKIEAVANKYDELDKNSQAAKLLIKMLALKEGVKVSPVEHFRDLIALVRVLYEEGKYADAKPYFEKALTVLEKNEFKLEEFGFLGLLGLIDEELLQQMLTEKRYGESIALLERSITIGETIVPTIKDDRKELIGDLVMLKTLVGNVNAAEGKLAAAQQHYIQAIDVKNRFEPTSQMDVFPKVFLAKVYLRQEQYSHAEPLFQYARKVFSELFELGNPTKTPPDPTDIDIIIDEGTSIEVNPEIYLETISGLALIHSRRGDAGEAETLYKELLTRTMWILRSYYMKAPGHSGTDPSEDQILDSKSAAPTSDDDVLLQTKLRNRYVEFLEEAAEFYRSVNKTEEAASLKSRAAHTLTLTGGKKQPNLPWPF